MDTQQQTAEDESQAKAATHAVNSHGHGDADDAEDFGKALDRWEAGLKSLKEVRSGGERQESGKQPEDHRPADRCLE